MQRHNSLPQELRDQLKRMQSNFAMGLFPSISRAWMSVDNELFLWNYDLNQDVAFFDGIKNTILRVDLVKPKPGFFPPAVHFILVVATTLDVVLLGASFTDAESRPISAGKNADYRAGAMYLLTNPLYQVSLEGALVNDVACTADGRIFFAADECVNEICFTDTYIIGKGFKKVNHTKSLIHLFVPALGMFSSKDHIRQLVVDDTRHILYVLFMKGTVEIFDLGADGKSTKKAGRIVPEQIQDEISRCCDMEPEFYKQIVNITPIPSTRSHYVYFEGTTSKGVRVYFTCLQTAPPNYPVQRTQSEARPVTIRIVHIRFPPGNPSVFASRHVQVYAAHRADDLTFMATSAGDVETALWAFCSSNFSFYASYIESLILLPSKGTVWSLALDDDDTVLRPPVGSDFVPDIQPPRIVEQHLHPVDKVHVLTTEGVFTFNHLSPLENMRSILAQHSSESKQFQAFAALHAPVDICLMALNIICSDSYRDAAIKDSALRVFFVYGGEPQTIREDLSQYRRDYYSPGDFTAAGPQAGGFVADISTLRSPLRASTPEQMSARASSYSPYDGASYTAGVQVEPSNRCDALNTYFARIMGPIWGRLVCTMSAATGGTMRAALSKDEVSLVLRQVVPLLKSIDEYALIKPNPPQHLHGSPASDAHAVEQERQQLQQLREFIELTKESLALWAILLENQFHAVAQMLPVEIRQMLAGYSFADFVANSTRIGVDLITCLVRHYMGDDATTSALSERLRSDCPLLFSHDDAMALSATESLYRAAACSYPSERMQMIDSAMSILRKTVQKVDMPRVCRLLQEVGYVDGIVELALLRAEKEDMKRLALIGYKKKADEADQAVVNATRRRNAAYASITDALDYLQSCTHGNVPSKEKRLNAARAKTERDALLQTVFDSDDELANVAVFRWMMNNGLADTLTQRRSRFFQEFLYHEIDRGESRCLELLWKYFEKNEDYIAAAKLLLNMVSERTTRVNLDQRLTYLSHALMCVQSAPQTGGNLQLKNVIQDKLDMAQIQVDIKNTVEAEAGMRIPEERAREAIAELNRELFTATELYDRFATFFDMPMIRLDLLRSVNHYDETLVEDIYEQLLKNELQGFERGEDTDEKTLRKVGSQLKKFRKRYITTPRFFPAEFILSELLMFSLKSTRPEWLPQLCQESGISQNDLLAAVMHKYRNDQFWRQNKKARQFVTRLCVYLCDDFVAHSIRLPAEERTLLKNRCLDILASLILDMHTTRDESVASVKNLEVLQAQIERII